MAIISNWLITGLHHNVSKTVCMFPQIDPDSVIIVAGRRLSAVHDTYFSIIIDSQLKNICKKLGIDLNFNFRHIRNNLTTEWHYITINKKIFCKNKFVL